MLFFSLIWRGVFKSGKDMLSALIELTENGDTRKILGQAGGLLAVISTALEITDKVYDEMRSPKERAYNRLSKYVLKIIKESLKDYRPDNDIIKREKIHQQISESFDAVVDKWDLTKWNSYLPDHPAIKEIIEKIEESNEGYRKVVGSINSDLVSKAADDPDYEVFNDWWISQKQYQTRVEYLEEIEGLRDEEFKIPNNKPLHKYYVDNNVIVDIPTDTLKLKDDQVRINYPSREIRTAIRDLIENNSKTIVVAGSFGTGKTSAMKMLSADFASKYLNSDLSSSQYIPIFISLNSPLLETEDKKFSLDDVLKKIVAPEGTEYAKRRPTLILFDSLEKYKGTAITIGAKIKQLREKEGFSNLKVIITTSLNQELLIRQQINVDKYTRMLPFNSNQLDKFFVKYDVREGVDRLNFKRAGELELPVQELFRPLFAWIFSYLETSEDSRVKVVERKDWTSKMKKAWMYYLFFHRMIAGIPREGWLDKEWYQTYRHEKNLLRALAALKQLHGISHELPILDQVVKTEIKNLVTQDIDIDISKIEKSYFLSLQDTFSGEWINFVYESFSDYLLAEYYIAAILDDKSTRLNIGLPNRETIDFLDGILDLLNKGGNDVEEYISSLEISEKTSLLASFRYFKGLSAAKKDLVNVAFNLIRESDIIIYRPGDNLDKIQSPEGMWLKIDSTNNDYKFFWIHRWLCLFILNKLIPEEGPRRAQINDELKEFLTILINYSGNLVPGYIKNLRYTDLSYANLKNANLHRADLSHADLSNANLFRADLSGADLSNANLSHADLTDVNMSDANLSHAKLHSCVLTRANLSDSNLEKIELPNAKLSYAILSYTNLSHADLTDANLSYANFSDANLSHAQLPKANLSYANFSDATLSGATMEGCCKIDNLVCHNANFNGVIMDENLLDYLKDNYAKDQLKAMNTPDQPRVKHVVPPEVQITVPSKDCKDVPRSSFIMATFNDTIKKDSIDKESFKLYNGQSPVTGSVSLISPEYKTAVFIPNDLLKSKSEYNVVITTKVSNLFDYPFENNMKKDINWKFTTANTAVFNRLHVLGITASGDDGNMPRNAIDDDPNTRWTDIGIGKWIQLDLGEPKNISSLQIAWFKGDRRIYYYKITLFNDKANIEGTVENQPEKNSKGDSLLLENTPIEGEARYIRITVNGNSLNNWASITSIEVCGTDISPNLD